MYFGRNEEGGLRCIYHGWKYDMAGQCVDMPSEPPESEFKRKVRLTSYPAREAGGVVWAYMGPTELTPGLPRFEWCQLPTRHLQIRHRYCGLYNRQWKRAFLTRQSKYFYIPLTR